MSKALPKYTIILHGPRKELGLTFFEYCLAESIDHLSNNAKYEWCTTSKQDLAEFFGGTRRGVQKILTKLIDKGIIERNDKDQLRTTPLWVESTQVDGGEQSSHPPANSVRTPPVKDEARPANSVRTIINQYSNQEKKGQEGTNSISSFGANRLEQRHVSKKEELTSKNSLTPCTELELWTIAKNKNIPLVAVKNKHKQIMEMINSGEFQTTYKKHKTVYNTLSRWLEMGIEKGFITECNEIEAMILDNDHPDIQAQVKWAEQQAIERGDI